jgi:sn-glycerol 3-phosphate transport system ATP-binding protein
VGRIELQHLRKTFNGVVEAVKDLNLVIEEGEFLVLVGPSGCGKTTTLRMVAGFEEPTSGQILIDDRVVNDLEPGRRNLGMVFQNLALFPHMTVGENIDFGPRMKKVDGATRRRRVREVADMVKITHLLDKLPSQCSGGEAQRVALARTLITEPSSFLLDEPLSNLDAKLRREMRAEIDRLHQALKKTFIYVTHDQEEAMTLADRIVVMREGMIEQVGTPLQIYSNPISYFVADFFGSPSMNLIPGALQRTAAGPCFRGASFALDLPAEFSHTATAVATLGLRPEHLSVQPNGGAFRAEVRLVEPLGKDTLLYFDYGGEKPLIAVVEGTREFRTGDHLGLRFDPKRLYLFDADGKRIC